MADPLPKRLELALRRGLIAAVRCLARRPRRDGPIDLPPAPRILLLRHDRFGDAIVTTAITKLLRERHPDATIELLLGHRNHAIAPLLPAVDDVIVLERGLGALRRIGRVLRPRSYDVVVDLMAKDSSSGALLSILSGARRRIGFAGALADIYDFAIPRPTRSMHIVPLTARLLAPFGIDEVGEAPRREAEMLELRVGSSADARSPLHARAPRIVFSISARDDDHMWPDESVAALVTATRDLGVQWTLAGVAAHRDRLETIAARCAAEGDHVTLLDPTPSFPAFVAALAGFDIIVTPQTSTVHVASALRRPVVLLNTSSDSDAQWTPWGVPHRTLARGPRAASITVDEAAGALRSLVEELRRGVA